MLGKWISTKELMERWNLKEIELVEYVTNGLQPYDGLGRPRPAPEIQKKLRMRFRNFPEMDYDEIIESTGCSWAKYKLPENPLRLRMDFRDYLSVSLFRIDQVEDIEKQNASHGKAKLPVQEDKERAIEIAKAYIRECSHKGIQPRISEAKKILLKEFATMYEVKTYHNWIKDIFPPESRKPGRPPKTTTS